jgi:hypothetical protein
MSDNPTPEEEQEEQAALDRIYGRLMPRIRRDAVRKTFWTWVAWIVVAVCVIGWLVLIGLFIFEIAIK